MTLIEITGVGALVRPEGDDHYRPKTRGDRVDVSEADARIMVANGTAKFLEQVEPADDAEDPQPMGGLAIDLDDPKTSIRELRQFAEARRIRLTGARTRPEILGMIRAALVDPEAGDAIQAAAVSPPVEREHPLVNLEAAEPGGPAAPPESNPDATESPGAVPAPPAPTDLADLANLSGTQRGGGDGD